MSIYDPQIDLFIRPRFRPFYRCWQGWRRILWWLWPIDWAVVEVGADWSGERLNYQTANGAACAMAKRYHELKRDEAIVEVMK